MSQGQSDSTATTAVISSTEASVAVDPMENFIPPLPESFMDKGLRKCRENPFVPVGALVTCAFLASGFSAFQKGQKKKMQLMMRGRVFAQGFTLVVICGSYFMCKYTCGKCNMRWDECSFGSGVSNSSGCC